MGFTFNFALLEKQQFYVNNLSFAVRRKEGGVLSSKNLFSTKYRGFAR